VGHLAILAAALLIITVVTRDPARQHIPLTRNEAGRLSHYDPPASGTSPQNNKRPICGCSIDASAVTSHRHL
jgi:hypothetical protein